MERSPRETQEFRPEITHSDEGVDIVIQRTYNWHFATAEDANKYFRRRYIEYRVLRWGIRGLSIAGVANVARDIEQIVSTHNVLLITAALAIGGVSGIVEGLNERYIGDRVRLNKTMVRRFSQERNAQ